MKFKLFYLLPVAILFVGFFVGSNFPQHDRYQDGRLSACKEMLNTLIAVNPLFALVKTECVVYKGDVALKLNEDIFSLDGTKKLN